MSCLGFENQPLHTKRVWKNLKLKLNTILRRRNRRRIPTLHRHRSFAPIYVDDLYTEPEIAHVEHLELPGEDKGLKVSEKGASNIDRFGAEFGDPSPSCSSFGPYLSAVMEMGEVDLRAEMFIRKFKEEMRLQRQKSFGEYQEMLARGVL